MKKICIFTWNDISSAYSCLLYLQKELSKDNSVDLWAKSPSSEVMNIKGRYNSFLETWYGKIRRFRVYAAKIHALFISFKYDVLIINDLSFFRIGYIVKKLFPRKKIIHYNTEIHGVDVPYPRHTIKFYEKHANYPDMIIECLNERAEYRKEHFDIKKDIYVINNTLPLSEVKKSFVKRVDISQYFKFKDAKLLTMIYAGGCNISRSLGDILECAADFSDRINFLFFCYGTPQEFNVVKNIVDQNENCYLYKAVDKTTLLNVMAKCDIGIQYYDPKISVNHYLASPSKFYEYISVGLNVISSNNHGINHIINRYDLGVCFNSEETIKDGIEKLLSKGLNAKQNIINAFKTRYCYEVDSENTIEVMRRLIDSE